VRSTDRLQVDLVVSFGRRQRVSLVWIVVDKSQSQLPSQHKGLTGCMKRRKAKKCIHLRFDFISMYVPEKVLTELHSTHSTAYTYLAAVRSQYIP
jgi:hypothetical protein